MKSRMADAIEVGRTGRKLMVDGLAGLGKRKNRDQNLATDKVEGNRWNRSEGRKGMAKEARGQVIVEDRARAGRGG